MAAMQRLPTRSVLRGDRWPDPAPTIQDQRISSRFSRGAADESHRVNCQGQPWGKPQTQAMVRDGAIPLGVTAPWHSLRLREIPATIACSER